MKMPERVVKRDGSLAAFDKSKIAVAIGKAFTATTPGVPDASSMLADEVTRRLSDLPSPVRIEVI